MRKAPDLSRTRLRTAIGVAVAGLMAAGVVAAGGTALAQASGMAAEPSPGGSAIQPADPPSPTPTDSPSPMPTDSPPDDCLPDEVCIYASDEFDLFDDDGPMPSPTADTAAAGVGVARLAARPCGRGRLDLVLHPLADGTTVSTTGSFTLQSFVGAPMSVTAYRRMTVNNVTLGRLFNDSGSSNTTTYKAPYRLRNRTSPLTVTATESDGAGGAPYFKYNVRGFTSTCRALGIQRITKTA